MYGYGHYQLKRFNCTKMIMWFGSENLNFIPDVCACQIKITQLRPSFYVVFSAGSSQAKLIPYAREGEWFLLLPQINFTINLLHTICLDRKNKIWNSFNKCLEKNISKIFEHKKISSEFQALYKRASSKIKKSKF